MTGGSREVTLSWSAPLNDGGPDVSDYVISISDGGPAQVVDDGVSTATSHTVPGLSNGTHYVFAVGARNSYGVGPEATTEVSPVWTPDAPVGFTATGAPAPGVGSGEVKLSWSTPADNGKPITDYMVERSVDGTTWTVVTDLAPTATTFTEDGLTNGTRYWYRVAAQNELGVGPRSVAEATPAWLPDAPDGLTAAVAPSPGVGRGQVELSWSAPADNGMPVSDYVIEWSTDGDTWTAVNDGTSIATTFTVDGLANATSYQFRVAAINAVGQGQSSFPIDATTPVPQPTAPTGLTAGVSSPPRSGTVELTWTTPGYDGGSPITDYFVQRSSDGAAWTTMDDATSTETTSTIRGLTNGVGYWFRVAAVNGDGAGEWSAAASAVPHGFAAAPGELEAAVAPAPGVGSGEVQLTWTTPDGGGLRIVDYAVESSADGVTWTSLNDGESAATSTIVDGLTNGTAYRFRVAAVNALGPGPWTAPVTATPAWTPGSPGRFAAAVAPAVGVGSRQVRLTWNAPSSIGGAAITDYMIQRSTNGTTWTTLRDGHSVATRFTVRGLANGTVYRFRVAARNGVGQSPWSATVRATPRWKPAAPGGLRTAVAPARGVGSGQVKVTWNAPGSSYGAAVTDYVIQRSTNGTTWTTVRDGVSNARTRLVTGLRNGTEYRLRIAARNVVGQGPWSATVRATPHAR